MKKILLSILCLCTSFTYAQSLDDLDSYSIDKVYKKIELDYGTLDEDGDEVDYIFVETEFDVDRGKYEIEITDGPGDLYEIIGTNYFVTFSSYYGFARYKDECILEVTGGYMPGTIYKLE
jgi:hypothetical protein